MSTFSVSPGNSKSPQHFATFGSSRRYHTKGLLTPKAGKSIAEGWVSALNVVGQGSIYSPMNSGRLYFTSISVPWSLELVLWNSRWGLRSFLFCRLSANSSRTKSRVTCKEEYWDYKKQWKWWCTWFFHHKRDSQSHQFIYPTFPQIRVLACVLWYRHNDNSWDS